MSGPFVSPEPHVLRFPREKARDLGQALTAFAMIVLPSRGVSVTWARTVREP